MTKLSYIDTPPFRTKAEADEHYRQVKARLWHPATAPETNQTNATERPQVEAADPFADIVIGAPNMLAVSAARRFLAGDLEGPLYIWGQHGTGKTTLARALSASGAIVFDGVDIAPPMTSIRAYFPGVVFTASRPPVDLEHPEIARMCMSAAAVEIATFDVAHARAVAAHQVASAAGIIRDVDDLGVWIEF